MRYPLQLSAITVLLAGAVSLAAAQQDAAQQNKGKNLSTGGPESTMSRGAPDSPPQDQIIGPPNAGPVPARGDPGMLPGASPETVPNKLSEENAARDAHWWLDRGQALTDEQKQTIYQRLARNGAKAGAGMRVFAEPSAVVPPGAQLHEIPGELVAEIPYIGEFKYVVEQNKVLLIDPVNSDVAAVIGE